MRHFGERLKRNNPARPHSERLMKTRGCSEEKSKRGGEGINTGQGMRKVARSFCIYGDPAIDPEVTHLQTT
jgi:hypothetical protein